MLAIHFHLSKFLFYHHLIGKLYRLNIFCQPVAVNSGYVWPKKGYLKSNKIINVSILKPIPPGLSSEDFLKFLENDIYNELDKFN